MILLLSSTSDPVGVAHSVLSVAVMLSNKPTDVLVGCPGPGWLPDQLARRRIPFVVLHHRPTIRHGLAAAVRLLLLLLRRKEIRTVYVNGRVTAFIGVIATVLLNRRFVLTIRQSALLGSSGLWSWRKLVDWTILRFGVQEISTVSRSIHQELRQRYGERIAGKCRVLPNFLVDDGADSSQRPDRSPMTSGSSWRILYVGRLVHEKGLDILLSALGVLRDRKRQFRCTVMGEGPLRYAFQQQARSLGILDQVAFLGAIPDATARFGDYDVLVVPSRHESFGRVVLEAWRARLPVTATCVEGLAELIVDGVNGLLVPSAQPSALADAIERVCLDVGLRQRLVWGGCRTLPRYRANEDLMRQYLEFLLGTVP